MRCRKNTIIYIPLIVYIYGKTGNMWRKCITNTKQCYCWKYKIKRNKMEYFEIETSFISIEVNVLLAGNVYFALNWHILSCHLHCVNINEITTYLFNYCIILFLLHCTTMDGETHYRRTFYTWNNSFKRVQYTPRFIRIKTAFPLPRLLIWMFYYILILLNTD